MTELSVDELREHLLDSPLGDDALQRLLDAAYAAIDYRVGASGTRTELVFGGYRTVAMSAPIASVTSITETIGTTTTTLDPTDYRVRPDGYTIERLATGSVNPRWAWWGQVEVTYTAVDDEAIRNMVAVDLCKLAEDYHPGLTSETIGSWTQQFGANSVWNNLAEYEAILERLPHAPSLIVVGESSWSAW